MTKVHQYLNAGYKLMPSGKPNSFIMARMFGNLGSCKDFTWKWDNRAKRKGHHTCCGSKRDYWHKVDCKIIAKSKLVDDYSDLKEI